MYLSKKLQFLNLSSSCSTNKANGYSVTPFFFTLYPYKDKPYRKIICVRVNLTISDKNTQQIFSESLVFDLAIANQC